MSPEKRLGLVVFAAVGGLFLVIAVVVAVVAASAGGKGAASRERGTAAGELAKGFADRPVSTGSPKDDADYVLGHRWWRLPPTRKRLDDIVAVLVELNHGARVCIDDVGKAERCPRIYSLGYEIPKGMADRHFFYDAVGDARPTREQVMQILRQLLDKVEFADGPASRTSSKSSATGNDSAVRPNTKPKSGAAKVYATGQDLFADMPKAAYPDGDAIERAAAQKWCQQNLVGRIVQWRGSVLDCKVTGDDPFDVLLDIDAPGIEKSETHLRDISFGEVFGLGRVRCRVVASISYRGFFHLSSMWVEKDGLRVRFSQCTVDEAKLLRAIKGRKATLQATIETVEVGGSTDLRDEDGQVPNWIAIRIEVSLPTVNGFLPIADRPKSGD